MFKKLLLSLLMATGISSTAHALTVEQFQDLASGDYRKATIMYLGGVNDAVRIFSMWGSEDCTEWKTLSPNQLIAAFEAHYANIEDKQQHISVWAFSYVLKHGGCADE